MRSVCNMFLPCYGDRKTVYFPENKEGERLNKGAFATVKNVDWNGNWRISEFLYCRDSFQDESSGLRRMLFVHERHKSKHVASFIHKIEHKLGVKPLSFFGPTQRNNLMWLMPSVWWTAVEMKRSLFTALLRAGQNYRPAEDNFEDALFDSSYGEANLYLRETRYAVERFLDGHTRYMGVDDGRKFCGWYHEFRWSGKVNPIGIRTRRTKTEIIKLLRKPSLCDLI